MALNYPGPYEIEITYEVTSGGSTLAHKQRLNVNVQGTPTPGTPATSITLQTRDGVGIALPTAVTAYAELMRALYNGAGVSLTLYEFYQYAPNSFDRTFITTQPIALVGTNPSGIQLAKQQTLSFKTQEGGSMFLVYLESSSGFTGIDPSPVSDVGYQSMANFVLQADSWILARDTSYPIAFRRQLGGQNEAVFRKRHR